MQNLWRFGAIVMLVASASIGTGCATMFTGSSQTVNVKAYPEGATTTVDGNPIGSDQIELERGKTHIVLIEKDGFEPRRIQLKQDLNGMFLVNLLWGPFLWVGMIVDAMTGAMHELTPGTLTVTLDPVGTTEARIAAAKAAPPPPPPGGTMTGGGPSLDPNINQRGTGMEKKPAPPPPPPAVVVVPPPPIAPPVAPPPGRQRPPRSKASAGQQKWVLAVMDTQLSGSKKTFSKSTLIALTDQIRVFLAARGMRVVDRSSQEQAMRSIVKEEKRASYKQCVDSSCQIPLGKALAASHIMRSSVAKFGTACATNGELIDLRAEVTVAAGSARSGCSEEDLLYAAESLAEQLVTGSAGKAR